jgi:hypothetical protein
MAGSRYRWRAGLDMGGSWGINAGVRSYNVRTRIRLHHEKKISGRSYEIITWEWRRGYVWFYMADSHRSSPNLSLCNPKSDSDFENKPGHRKNKPVRNATWGRIFAGPIGISC